MEKLAIEGGTPVRTKPFPTAMLGASQIGEEELALLKEVVEAKSPFRFYGIGTPDKVATLEERCAKWLGTKYALAVSSGSSATLDAVA